MGCNLSKISLQVYQGKPPHLHSGISPGYLIQKIALVYWVIIGGHRFLCVAGYHGVRAAVIKKTVTIQTTPCTVMFPPKKDSKPC